eukprot:3387736-Pyramimonas_sp.AAC.1
MCIRDSLVLAIRSHIAVSHYCPQCTIPRSIICRIHLMCPKSAHSVGFFRSWLDDDLKTSSATMS